MSLYPTPPSLRMAYDLDGSVGFRYHVHSGIIDVLPNSDLQILNNEANDGVVNAEGTNGGTHYLGVIFPELRDLTAAFISYVESYESAEWSANTTSGSDGAWTAMTVAGANNVTSPNYRTGISALAISGAKAVRFGGQRPTGGVSTYFNAIHVYGHTASGQNPDRLRIWHPTLNQEIAAADLDLQDQSRGSAAVKQFRVKNNSATLTANTITGSLNVLTDGSPATSTEMALSLDGSTYTATIAVGSLAPGAISSVLYLRNTLGLTAQLGLRAVRLRAVAASFS